MTFRAQIIATSPIVGRPTRARAHSVVRHRVATIRSIAVDVFLFRVCTCATVKRRPAELRLHGFDTTCGTRPKRGHGICR